MTCSSEITDRLALLTSEVGKLWPRPRGLTDYAELSTAMSICRREDFDLELKHIMWYRGALPYTEKRFFPQSLMSLLSRWGEVVDRAHTFRQEQRKSQGPTQAEVTDYALQKWGYEFTAQAMAFYMTWARRGWLRDGRPIDWQEQLTKLVASQRAQ